MLHGWYFTEHRRANRCLIIGEMCFTKALLRLMALQEKFGLRRHRPWKGPSLLLRFRVRLVDNRLLQMEGV